MARFKAGEEGRMQFKSYMARIEFDIKQKELKRKNKPYWKLIENNIYFTLPVYKRIVPKKIKK